MMPQFLQDIIAWFESGSNAVEALAIVVITLFAHYAIILLYRRLLPKLKKTKTEWDDILAYALFRPFGFFIWAQGLTFAAQVVGRDSPDVSLFSVVEPVREVAIIYTLAWFAFRFITATERHFVSSKRKKDETTVRAIGQLLRASVLITSGLIALQEILGINISGIIAFGGVGGVVIGFAAKDLLANFFGGLMVYFDRPFAVGDWIRSPDRNIEGTVEQIGWRLTRIRTFDKRPLYIPNSLFSTIIVENPSRMENRRIRTNIGVRYDDAGKIAKLLPAIEAMLRDHPEIDTNKTLMVNLIEFAPSSLNFMVYTFTKTTEWVKFQAIQQDIFLKIIEIITQHGAECAFPTTTLHVPEGVKVEQA